MDLANCRERRALRTAVQAQEAAVAAALGVGMLYTQQEASLGPSYRQALERLAAAAAQRGHVGGGRFRALPILLQPAGSAAAAGAAAAAAASGGSGSGSGSSGPGGCTADSEAGLLAAPMDVAPEQLYAAVEALGGRVLAALQQRQQREAQLAALRTQVERKLMLRWAAGAWDGTECQAAARGQAGKRAQLEISDRRRTRLCLPCAPARSPVEQAPAAPPWRVRHPLQVLPGPHAGQVREGVAGGVVGRLGGLGRTAPV